MKGDATMDELKKLDFTALWNALVELIRRIFNAIAGIEEPTTTVPSEEETTLVD